MKYILLIICCVFISFCYSQPPVSSYDLSSKWLVFKNNKYTAYKTVNNFKTIHIHFSAREGAGDFLHIQCKNSVTLFLNQQYLQQSNSPIILSIDSLRKAHDIQSFVLSIYSDNLSKKTLSTFLIHHPVVQALPIHTLRPINTIRNFVLIASVIVLVLLIFIIKLNPKLASDYFSVTKIFSLRESEDSQVYTRVTSSSNFLSYGFSSLTIGFYLTILFTQLPQFRISQDTIAFHEIIQNWFLTSILVALSFIVKMLIVYLFASLFKMTEVIGFQFFNWVRLLFLLVGFALLIMSVSLLSSTNSIEWFDFFFRLIGWAIAGWVILVFFKVASKARIGVFHLFSYLCVTEIIPSLIVLKILYY